MNKIKRCEWCLGNELDMQYHDEEWGVPVHDDSKLFELLTLEGAQAGLSWSTVLKKRESYLELLDHFDIEKVARYNKRKIESLLKNPGIIRNRLKVESTVSNAKRIIQIQKEHGSFDNYVWQFVDYKPIINKWKNLKQVPATTEISDRMSKTMKKQGFRFIGSTICYAFMQAAGMVNDHTTSCFRYKACNEIWNYMKGQLDN